jgi:glycosyltransferase involved in cell wall biosynthesis
MTFVDLTYYHSAESNPQVLMERHRTNMGYLDYLPDDMHAEVMKFMDYEGQFTRQDVQYHFMKGSNRKLWMPLRQHRAIHAIYPDLVLVHGLSFQPQVLLLHSQLDKPLKIVVQHHGEQPFKGLRRRLQKYTDKYIDGYLFTSKGNAAPWVEDGQVSPGKVFEILPGSTDFRPQPQAESMAHCDMGAGPNFLWVGRLNKNKDPLTVLLAFSKYVQQRPGAKLYMIYHTNELLEAVQAFIQSERALQGAVKLVGKVPHHELVHWYSAADFFILGSHRESCGYALLEAMACGCFPIVTDIPSFNKITAAGKYGSLYTPGDAAGLIDLLSNLHQASISREEIVNYFRSSLSFKNIADRWAEICDELMSK